MAQQFDRKQFLRRCGMLAVNSVVLFAACSDSNDGKLSSPKGEEAATGTGDANPTDCHDLRGVTQSELDKRKQLGYVKEAPSPDVRCEVCKLYLPADAGKNCGACSLFKGPVAAVASCTYFAPLSEEEG